jgi:hypothetical protein
LMLDVSIARQRELIFMGSIISSPLILKKAEPCLLTEKYYHAELDKSTKHIITTNNSET